QLFAGSRGFLDNLKNEQVHPFADALLEYFQGPAKELRDELVQKKSIKGELEEKLKKAVATFKETWTA
ncbi:MAG: F0F1 ATP synthase subunit alpha, partial [Phycisphaeraceae bacterium]